VSRVASNWDKSAKYLRFATFNKSRTGNACHFQRELLTLAKKSDVEKHRFFYLIFLVVCIKEFS